MEEATHRQPQSVPLIAALAGALLALAVSPAFADEDRPLTDKEKRAGELFELADTHYAAGRYEQAAKFFKEGYKLAPHPEFLYSLGNTYERMGQYDKAADYLKRYVKSPLAQDVVSVRERIKRLEAAAEEARRERERVEEEEKVPVDDLEGDDDDDGEAAAVVDSGASRSRAHYYWFAGAGVGLAGAATLGLLSRSAASDASSGCSGGICEESARRDLDREKQLAVMADISLVAGVAAGVVGAVLLFKRSSKDESADRAALRLEPVLTPEGGGVGLAGSF